MSHRAPVRVARVYDEPTPEDGRRILVDRLWPRGLRKDDPRIDDWNPRVAPSAELRRWYGHRPERFEEFSRRYEHELTTTAATEAVGELRDLARRTPLTLVTATRDLATSHLVTLARVVNRDTDTTG